MIFESIPYRDGLPFSVSFINITEENRHCHKEIEILMVLRGIARYRIYHTDYELNPGDLIIADVEDLHQIHDASDDILMLQVHVDTAYFQDKYPDIRYMFFVCEECMEAPAADAQMLQSKLAILKNCLSKLAITYCSGSSDIQANMAAVNDLVSILVSHFQGFFMEDYQYKTISSTMSGPDLQRLCRITRYILTNYSRKITLQDVSEMEHLSTYYVSHLIKKTLGFNFQNFVNAIRLEFAEKQLVFTDLTLMQISENCGFSSPNYFNKCFSAWHGKTPSAYRKDYHPGSRKYGSPFSRSAAPDLLLPYMNLSDTSGSPRAQAKISVDMSVDCEKTWQDDFAPSVYIDDIDMLIGAGRCRSELENICPPSYTVNRKIMEHVPSSFDAPIRSSDERCEDNGPELLNHAAVLNHIFNTGCPAIPLFGNRFSLVTKAGLFTPYYRICRYYASQRDLLLYNDENCVIAKSKDMYSLAVFNINPHSVLEVHIDLSGLPETFYMSRMDINEKDNCCSFPLSENPIPSGLIRELNGPIQNNREYMLVNRESAGDIDLIVYQNCVALLEYYV